MTAANTIEEALRLARILWDYHQLNHTPIPADVIVALGTNDLRVAEFAADLYHGGYGKQVVCTGCIAHASDLLATRWDVSEAEMYAAVLERRGVPKEDILLETRASNTAENFRFTRELLREAGIQPKNILIAVKPFMQRRAWATLAVEWPEMPASVASPNLTLDEYFTSELAPERIINILTGDLQRIWVYARKGYSAPQFLPDEVKRAYDGLVALGYTEHLIVE
jgi:uncharacterized SAM-binding protein YcdF (DUF218 family)